MMSKHAARGPAKTAIMIAAVLAPGFFFTLMFASPIARPAPLRVHVGEKAPGFTLPSTSGKMVSLSGFAGQNVLLDIYEGYW